MTQKNMIHVLCSIHSCCDATLSVCVCVCVCVYVCVCVFVCVGANKGVGCRVQGLGLRV